MSNETTATAPVTASVAAPKSVTAPVAKPKAKPAVALPKPAAAPKAATKPAAAKPAPKAAAAPAPAKKEAKKGLRQPQVRILAALKKAGKALSRADISQKAPVDPAACVEYIGSNDADVRKANDAKHFPSLISLKLVKFANPDEGAATVYEITAAGTQALEKAQAESKAKPAAKKAAAK
jgi:hypothetical protein